MTISIGDVELPDDLVWVDEFKYSTTAQNKQRTLTGKNIIQESTKIFGRPMTLHGGADSGWTTRQGALDVQALADIADNDLLLTFHDRTFTVRFDHSSGVAVDSYPIIDCTDPSLDDPYAITIKLMTV